MAIGRIRHFEWVCRLLDVEPKVERLMVFYSWRCVQGWYTLANRIKDLKICTTVQSLRTWKREFFFIAARVIPLAMQFQNGEKLPKMTLPAYQESAWFDKISRVKGPIYKFPEKMMVRLGMSRVWKDDGLIPIVLEYGSQPTPWGMLYLLPIFRVLS